MSGLPHTYGVQFPTSGRDAGNPYPPSASGYAIAPPQQQQAQIQPGSITYTTSTLPDGRIQYNQFKAESRSYQTAQGPVYGIQWVPVQAVYELPSNALPAGPDFHASWSRQGDKDSQRRLKEWQRDQEKRVKKEEKESAKRMKEWDRDQRDRVRAEEKELRRAQELDIQREGRGRRLSNVGYGDPYSQYSAAATVSSAYSRARSHSRARRDSTGQDELTRAMAEMAMEKDWAASEAEGKWGREPRERRGSNVGRPRTLSVNGRSRKVSMSEYEYERTRKTSGTPYPTAGRAAGVYPSYRSPSPARGGYSDRAGSPFRGGGSVPPAAHGIPVYPPGHIYAGKPIPGMQGDKLGTVGGPYRQPSPRLESLRLESPAGFSRPPSLAVPYTPFEAIVIMADLNEFYEHRPLMPAVLGPHDVWVEDWVRCLEDLARAWTGKMAISEKLANLKPRNVVAQLIDVWNAAFFAPRGVELVLFHGRERRSGPHAGRYDTRLGFELSSEEESDTISSVSSDSDAEGRYAFYGSSRSRHGGTRDNHWLADSREARRVRKAEKKNRDKQKKRRDRERAKERGSGYSLILTCTNEGQARLQSMAGYAGYPA